MDEYQREFVRESEEHITSLNNSLLTLEQSPDDEAAMDAIFRTAHTLKGNCGAMGLTRVSDLAHAMEDLLAAVRSGEIEVTSSLMDTVFDAVDELEAMIDEVGQTGEVSTDPAPTIEQLRSRIGDSKSSGPISRPTDAEIDSTLSKFDPPANEDHDTFYVRLSIEETPETNNGHLVVEALIDAFDLIGTDPSREAIEAGEYGYKFDAVFGSAVDESAIASALEPVDAVEEFEIETVTDRFDSLETQPGSGAQQPGTDVSSEDVQEMAVDDLLDEFAEFDDLDAMAEEVEDVSALENMGQAGSFDDLLDEDEIEPTVETDDGDTDSVGQSDDISNGGGEQPPAEAVDDAESVFAELKQEVEMVGFDELQDELEDLEFDEFDSDDEVDMDELLGDDIDVGDNSFLEVSDEQLEAEVDDILVEDSVSEEVQDSLSEDTPDESEIVADEEAFADFDIDEDDLREQSTEQDSDLDQDSLEEMTELGAVDFSDEPSAQTDVSSGDVNRAVPDEPPEDAPDETDDAIDEADSLPESEQKAHAGVDANEPELDETDEQELDETDEPEIAEADDPDPDTEDEPDPVTEDEPDLTEEDEQDLDETTEFDDPAAFDTVSAGETTDFAPADSEYDSSMDGIEDAFDERDEPSELDDIAVDSIPADIESTDDFEADFQDDEFDSSVSTDLAFEPVTDDEFEVNSTSTFTDEPDSDTDLPTTDTDSDPGDGEAAGPEVDEDANRMPIPDITVPDTPDLEDEDQQSNEIQSVRVGNEQIDSLLTLVEGLVTSRVRLRHAIESGADLQTIDRELDGLEDLTTELQETVMDVRLVPLQTVATRLPRVVRDIAREQNKEVSFEQSGEEVELDRSILDRIGDPLIHLVRNAVDHGIEPPAQREAQGKPREATIELRATQTRDRVRIEVVDDGAGLDPDQIRTSAVEADILEEPAATELDDEEALDLVFHPGLSTVDEVTDVSGRGVGMDVVKRTVEELDGTVKIDSEPGEGTTITMELPVTVAIADVLFLESGGEEFGVPVKSVQNVADGSEVETIDGQQVFTDGDEELPVIDLAAALETPGAGANGDGTVIRIRDEVRSVGLHCDEVHGQQEVVIKPFEGFMGGIPGLSGATVRGRGKIVNILDVNTL